MAPLTRSFALEIALGKDLSQVQEALVRAKAALAQVSPKSDPESAGHYPGHVIQSVMDVAFPSKVWNPDCPLGPPKPLELLNGASGSRAWRRTPHSDEALLLFKAKPGTAHALRPSSRVAKDTCLVSLLEEIRSSSPNTFCGKSFASARLAFLQHTSEVPPGRRCCLCFGKARGDASSSDSAE